MQEEESETPNSQSIGVIRISGSLKVYLDQNLDESFTTFPEGDPSVPFNVYEISEQNPDVMLIGVGSWEFWINTTDPGAKFDVDLFEDAVATRTPYDHEVLSRWDELEEFVNTDLAELQRRAVENPEIIGENVALLEDIFGYDVEFRNREFYVRNGKNEEKSSAIRQIFNIASSHYHVTNTFGIEIMRTTTADTIYHFGADSITKTKYHGLVPLGQGSTEVFIGSEMAIGGITHETFHEIDRRFGGIFSVHYYYDEEAKTVKGEGGLEWFLKTKVINRYYGTPLGFNFGMILHEDSLHLNEDSRASDEVVNQEIFPDVAAAVVFGLHEENFFSKADVYDPDNRIGFASYNSYVKDLICGFHQYFEQVVKGVRHPDDFNYSPDECIQ